MDERLAKLEQLQQEASGCTRCRLAEGRTQVVFGVGNPDAELMFVGEAPGFHEDKQGFPFVGQAGKLLDKLLAGIGLTRSDVYVANVLKCRPPGNRDPQPDEIELCEGYLFRQIESIEPKLVATLGNFATSSCPASSSASLASMASSRRSRSAAATCCSTRSTTRPRRCTRREMLEVLEEDFRRIPGLISRILLAEESEPAPTREHPELAIAAPVSEPAVQLGLF